MRNSIISNTSLFILVGKEARHHLLAYAFLKEIPYLAVEEKCRENNKPDAQAILNIVRSCICDYDFTHYPKTWSVDSVKLWLSGNNFSLQETKKNEKREIIKAFRRGMTR